MTLSAYSGRHATFDATTVLTQAPSTGAPPGRPAAVDAAFWVAVAASLVSMLGAALLTVLLVVLGLGHRSTGATIVGAGLLLVTAAVNAGWLVTGWRARRGSPGARTGFAVLTAAGLLASLLVCLVAWSTVLPLLTAVLQSAVLVLLVLPASTAWFRR